MVINHLRPSWDDPPRPGIRFFLFQNTVNCLRLGGWESKLRTAFFLNEINISNKNKSAEKKRWEARILTFFVENPFQKIPFQKVPFKVVKFHLVGPTIVDQTTSPSMKKTNIFAPENWWQRKTILLHPFGEFAYFQVRTVWLVSGYVSTFFRFFLNIIFPYFSIN